MLAVCVSHIGDVIASQRDDLAASLITIGMIATPAFLLFSGISAGYVIRPNADVRSRLKLVDRGLFLLVVAHALLAVAHRGESSVTTLYASLFITDSVAVALFVASLTHNWGPSRLLVSGGALVMIGWVLPGLWQSESGVLSAAGRILFYTGRPSDFPLGYTVPVGSYLGVFLIGMSFSRGNRGLLEGRDLAGLRRLGLAMLGVIVILSSVKVGTVLLKQNIGPEAYEIVRQIVDPRQKRPMGVAYLLQYGAAAMLVLVGLLWLNLRSRAHTLLKFLATIGQASLMVFVLQEALIFAGSHYLGVRTVSSVGFWVGYLAMTVLIIWLAARAWSRIEGNRFLTVGLKRAYERMRTPGGTVLDTATVRGR